MKEFSVVGVIPSLNPDQKLVETVEGMLDAGFTQVIVVDDGSREDCRKYFDMLESFPGCRVLRHEKNCGKGRALKTAFSCYLKDYDLEYYHGVLTADADGQHLPEDCYKTALEISESKNKSKIALGTRDFSEENVPFKSRNGNRITTEVFRLLYGKRIEDTQTGLRGLSNQAVQACTGITGERFEYEINMLIRAVMKHWEMAEVPIETVYFDSNRETHFRPVLDSIKIYRVMFRSFFRFAASGIASAAMDQGLFALIFLGLFAKANPDWTIPLSTVLARVGSSFFNYSLNRTLVFDAGKTGGNALRRYYLLCLCQMIASALGVTMLYRMTGIHSSVLKFLVDGVLFLVSYRIQQSWVFSHIGKTKTL